MKNSTRHPSCRLLLPALAITVTLCVCSKPAPVEILPPEELYGQLFHDVQSDTVLFTDSKTFPDCIPEYAPSVIRKKYAKLGSLSGNALSTFIDEHFTVPTPAPGYTTDSLSIEHHITSLWSVLQRLPDVRRSGTLIPLPNSYIVPGGRFREIYYWDSYFTMLGLAVDKRTDIMNNMFDNFSYLIDMYGFIPNGNRTYYLSRSQPPFYALMVALLALESGNALLQECVPRIEKEYAFWMNGRERLDTATRSYKRVVLLDDGSILNRYRDDQDSPRAESYREDRKTARQAMDADPRISEQEVFRSIRSAAESGWDFSSRWLSKDTSGNYALHTIHTTSIIPVDLNSLLYTMELMLSNYFSGIGDSTRAVFFTSACKSRKKALYTYCWNSDSGFFFDYDFTRKAATNVISVAGVYPMFAGLADSADARRVAGIVRRHLLQPGGIAATVNTTGQQWDKPNGWAPLQWITVAGLRQYGITALADTITARWCSLNRKVYQSTYKLCEKYNVVDTTKAGGGGEYPTQDGFGWTNGVFKKLCCPEL